MKKIKLLSHQIVTSNLHIFCVLIVAVIMGSCQLTGKKEVNSGHKIIVQEVIQVPGYTYMRVNEDKTEQWVATSTMNAEPGQMYYYDEGLTMTNFESKELNRTFKSIIFIQKLTGQHSQPAENPVLLSPGSAKTDLKKLEISIEKPSNGVSIAELYSNKEMYAGKKIIVRGIVTKFSPEIMGKNWVHLQDGSESNGSFDLTITSGIIVNPGDTVTLKGNITLNNDLGYGYFYDILMQDAVIVSE